MDLFGTAGIRGDVRERVTPELALAVGRAAAADAAARGSTGERAADEAPEFVVGRDGRETGSALVSAVAAGLQATGSRVVRVGQVPTPALAFASRGRYGVMVTASHNPPTDNGLKLFRDGEEYDREAERRIEDRVADGGVHMAAWTEWRSAEETDVLPAYRERVVDYAHRHGAPLDGLPVAVDCGAGTGALATPQVLRELGGRVVALNGQVDGHFPGRESKPTPESLRDLREFVRGEPPETSHGGGGTSGRDFEVGFGHDGDADRVVVVDAQGEVVHEDTVLAILAEHFVRVADADRPVVVTTPNASARIDERVHAAGGRVERVRLGALHEEIADVAADAEEGGPVVFAGEPWKHLHPEYGPWIDGVASVAVFARLVADRGLDTLRDPVTERPYRKVSVACPDDRKVGAMEALAESLPEAFPDASVSTDHGIRLELPDGCWVLVRPSGTEPYVRIYAESDDVDALVDRARAVVEAAT